MTPEVHTTPAPRRRWALWLALAVFAAAAAPHLEVASPLRDARRQLGHAPTLVLVRWPGPPSREAAWNAVRALETGPLAALPAPAVTFGLPDGAQALAPLMQASPAALRAFAAALRATASPRTDRRPPDGAAGRPHPRRATPPASANPDRDASRTPAPDVPSPASAEPDRVAAVAALARAARALGPAVCRLPPRLSVRDGLFFLGDRTVVGLVDAAGAPVDVPSRVGAATVSVLSVAGAERAIRTGLIEDLRRSAALSTGGVLLVLALFFRSWRAPLVVLSASALGLLVTVALAALAGLALSPLAWSVGVILVGLGVDASIHLVAEHVSQARAGEGARATVRRALARTRTPIVFAALTTGGALAVLALAPSRPLREMALVAVVGLAWILLFTVTLTTDALRAWGHRLRPLAPIRPPTARVFGRASVVILILGLAATTQLRTESQAELAIIREQPLMKALHRFSVRAGATLSSLTLTSTGATLSDALAAERRAIRTLAPLAPLLGVAFVDAATLWIPAPDSLAEAARLLDEAGDGRLPVLARALGATRIDRMRRAVQEVRDQAPATERLAARYARRTGPGVTLEAHLHLEPRPWGVSAFDGFQRRAGEVSAPPALMARITAPGAARGAGTSPLYLAAVVGWVAVLLVLQLRSLTDVVACLTPVAVGLAAAVACMWAFDVAFSLFTLPALCLVAGVGVDDGIHVAHRRRQAHRGDDDLGGVTPALIATTLTSVVALSALAVARSPGLGALALVGATGLVGALLGALATATRPAAPPTTEPARRTAATTDALSRPSTAPPAAREGPTAAPTGHGWCAWGTRSSNRAHEASSAGSD